MVKVGTTNNCSESVKVHVTGFGLKIPDDLISDVAFGPNSTYFILNPQVPIIMGGANLDISIHAECTLTVDIPAAPSEPPGWLEPADTPLDYLMFPIGNMNWRESEGLEVKEAAKKPLGARRQNLGRDEGTSVRKSQESHRDEGKGTSQNNGGSVLHH